MWKEILPALKLKLLMTVLLGVVYPLAITGLCQALFPRQANGSLIRAGNQVIGSDLIGQNFEKPEYIHPRPSAAGNGGYDATASGGSNYGPTNQQLIDRVKTAVAKFRKENPDYTGPLPADIATASASGLDPHISPEAARAQAARVAKARGVPPDAVDRLLSQYVEEPDLGWLGEPRVNVLRVNLALDRAFPKR
jgi:potassium-transporting ATPase KdpC subunit